MNCKIEKSYLSGNLDCPSNKSYTHRAIFLACLVDGKTIIKNILRSQDTLATIQSCKKFGAEIDERDSNLTVKSTGIVNSNSDTIDAKNSGTTIRIASAIASLREGKTVLSGDESLIKRPMKPLLEALESIGAHCSSNHGRPPITINGKITGGVVTIPGNISSQFISALLLVGPKTDKGIILNISNSLVSKPYLDATIASMKKFGAEIETVTPYEKYKIPRQNYKSTTFTIPSDFSSLALLLSAAVLVGDKLTIHHNPSDLPQGDEKIIDMLKILGVRLNVSDNTITVQSPEKLQGGKFDLNNNPDLLPPLSILSLKTSKPIELYNVKHARYKETDRLAILAKELSKLGISVIEKEDRLILEPPSKTKGAFLNSQNDHRLFMAFCIAGLYVGNCTVSNPESIEVSYPNFISEMKKVGANIQTNV